MYRPLEELVFSMHAEYGINNIAKTIMREDPIALMRLRGLMQLEEAIEMLEALGPSKTFNKKMKDLLNEAKNSKSFVSKKWDKQTIDAVLDAAIDSAVFAIGTTHIITEDYNMSASAINEVMRANLEKKVGEKKGREVAKVAGIKLPDLVKPSNWKAPDNSNIVNFVHDATVTK